MQKQHFYLRSQRTGAELNRLGYNLIELDFAMDFGLSRKGMDRLN